MKIHTKDYIWITVLSISGLLLLNIFIPKSTNRHLVLDRQIFIPETSEESSKSAEVKKSIIQLTTEESRGFITNLELLGTLIGNTSLAFIYNSETNHPGLYKINDKIGDLKIVSILPGKVLLDKNGTSYELLLVAGNRQGIGDNRSVVTTDETGTMIISKLGMFSQLMKANELLSKIKILPLPDVAPNKLRGFRIDNVPSGSIIEEIGIRNGDIIYSVQGQKMQSMQDALQMFNNVQNQSRIEVVLLRDDKPVTLHYEIH